MFEAHHSYCARPDATGRKSVKITVLFMVLLTIFCHNSAISEVLQDPTRPPEYKNTIKGAGTKAAPRFVLSSTLIAPGRRLATINGKTVAVGEQVAGAQVVAIEPSRVALRDGSREIILELLASDFKRMH